MNGIINVLKPPMMTSNNVVAAVKKYTGQAHVGHTGTLDPNAAGVLPICIGRSTKLAEYFLADEKEYIGELLFGIETDSCDTEGNITATSDNIPTEKEIADILPSFCGDVEQLPPIYSAIKINGKKAYELARKNIEVDMPKRNVFVHSIEILSFTAHNRAVIKVRCSKGTYIRSLARDIGRGLNSRACLSMLVRTRCGVFDIADAVTLDEIKNAFLNGTAENNSVLMNVNTVLSYLPYAEFDSQYYKKLVCGNCIELSASLKYSGDASSELEQGTPIRIICDSEFVGIGKLMLNSKRQIILQPTKVIVD